MGGADERLADGAHAGPRAGRAASSKASTAPPSRSFRPAFRTHFYESLDALHKDLDAWLIQYDCERSHQGYRNLGKRPINTVKRFAKNVREEG